MVWKLYLGGHKWSEGSAFVEVPRRAVSYLDAVRIFREVRDRWRARGLGIWFARAEDGEGRSIWLADHRGTLRGTR